MPRAKRPRSGPAASGVSPRVEARPSDRVHTGRVIAVVLSGTGSDGTLGCQSVKAAGGIAFAQDPASAKYDGMPKSAIAGGSVDFVLPPEGIAKEIVRLAREPYVRADRADEAGLGSEDRATLPRIFALLRKATGADFTCYKRTTATPAKG